MLLVDGLVTLEDMSNDARHCNYRQYYVILNWVDSNQGGEACGSWFLFCKGVYLLNGINCFESLGLSEYLCNSLCYIIYD